MRKSAVFTALTVSLLAGAAFAQTNPSAQQIISALTPSGNVSGTTRGIKPLAPGMGSTMAPMSSPMAPMSGPMAMNTPKPALGTPIAETNLNVVFATGSADLTPQATATLDQLADPLGEPFLQDGRLASRLDLGRGDLRGDLAFGPRPRHRLQQPMPRRLLAVIDIGSLGHGGEVDQAPFDGE